MAEAQCSVSGPRYLEEVGDDFLRVGLEGAVDKQKLKNVPARVRVSFAT